MDESHNQALIIDVEDVDEQQMTELLQMLGFHCTGYGRDSIGNGRALCQVIDLCK